MSPRVTVVMPLYEGARYVAEAVDSVLAQTHDDLELVVVDDGSTDDGPAVVRRYGPQLALLTQAHAGLAAARNRGVRAARGDYLAFIDADDRWPPSRLEGQVAILDTEPACDAVFGGLAEFVSPELGIDAAGLLRAPVIRLPARFPTTMLVRRDAFWRVGPFDEGLRRATDVDWLARADESGWVTTSSPDIATERRLNLSSNGIRELGNEIEYVHTLRTTLERRRRLAGTPPE